MVSSNASSRSREGFGRPSDREDIVYRDRGQLGLSTKKLDTKGHHGRQPPDSRTESPRNGDRKATEYRRGCAGTDGTPGRLPGVGEVPSGPRNEDMGARNGPQGTQAAPQLIRSTPERAERAPAGYGRVSQEGVQRPWWRRVFGRRTQ